MAPVAVAEAEVRVAGNGGPQEARQLARCDVQIVRARFQSGLDRLLDVFDARTQAYDLEVQYLNLLVSHKQAKDMLSQLVGASLESLPVYP